MRWNDGCDILLSLICSICSHYVDASSSVDFVSESLKIINDGYKEGSDGFGHDIAVNENLLVVGAPGEHRENYTKKGSVTVFRRQNGVLQQPGKKLRTDVDSFGISVGVNEDFIVVGSRGDGFRGITSIYRSCEPYELVKTIQVGDAWSVIINNENTIFIGDPYTEDNHGAVHIYSNDKLSQNWTLSQTLKPPVAKDFSYFGRYISSSPQYLVVTSESSVFTYRKNTDGAWNFDQNLAQSIPFSNVIIESERLFIGSIRENKTYVYNLLNNTWTLSQTIQPPDVEGFRIYEFSTDISVQGDVLVIGAPVTTFKDAEAGACFLYVLNHATSQWTIRAVLIAPNGAGRLVLYDNKVFVQSQDIARNFSGSVHEYDVSFLKPENNQRTENNILAWYVILIIVLISLLIVVVPLLLVIRYKKRTNTTIDASS